MSVLENSESKTEFSIHPKTMMGHISLTVASLDNQIVFYQQAIGFKLHWWDGNKAGLGAGGNALPLLTVESNLNKYRGTTGLYHFAYLLPNHRKLAIKMTHLFALKNPNRPTSTRPSWLILLHN